MEIHFLQFDRLEFIDRHGVTRTIAGCSLLGREEFRARLNQIQERLKLAPEGESVEEFFDHDPRFRFLCCRALELNAVDPDWVTVAMMSDLLFGGMLVQLNAPRPSNLPSNEPEEPATIAEMLGGLATHSGVREALDLANDPGVPANLLMEMLAAKNRLIRESDPKEKQKAQQRKWQDRAMAELQALREAAGVVSNG